MSTETRIQTNPNLSTPASMDATAARVSTSQVHRDAEYSAYLDESDTCSETEILEAVQGFLLGDLTLAQLEGLSAEDLYQVADLGYDLMMEGRLEDARKLFEGLYCYNPFDSYFHVALGSIYQRLEMLEESFNHYESAIQLYDQDIVAWANLGEVALELATRLVSQDPVAAGTRFEQAVEALGRAIALDVDGRHPSGLRARALVAATASAA